MLRPGGRFLCLEFSRVLNPVLRVAYERYSFDVIPSLGAAFANDRDSYQYLVESIRQFPQQVSVPCHVVTQARARESNGDRAGLRRINLRR